LVKEMEYEVEVDSQGRVVLPAEIRQAIGIIGKAKVKVRMKGIEVTITVLGGGLKHRVEEWFRRLSSMRIQPFTEKGEYGPLRWYSDEYVRKKLGIS